MANDIPWALIPIAIFFQALLLGFAWRRTYSDGDWLSTSVFCYTFLGLLFIPQNLQLAASGPIYLGYIFFVGLYIA